MIYPHVFPKNDVLPTKIQYHRVPFVSHTFIMGTGCSYNTYSRTPIKRISFPRDRVATARLFFFSGCFFFFLINVRNPIVCTYNRVIRLVFTDNYIQNVSNKTNVYTAVCNNIVWVFMFCVCVTVYSYKME